MQQDRCVSVCAVHCAQNAQGTQRVNSGWASNLSLNLITRRSLTRKLIKLTRILGVFELRNYRRRPN